MDGTRRSTLLGSIPSARWVPLILLLQVVSVCIAGENPDRAVSESDNVLIDVRAVPDSLGALYTVKCFDGEHKFMVDTGASCTVVDNSFRPKLGEPLGRTRVNGGVITEVFAAPKLELAGVVPANEEAFSCDFRQMSEVLGHDIAGVVGMDALSQYVLELDLAGERTRLLRKVPDETRRMDERFQIRRTEGGTWVVSATLPDGEEDFQLDTGSNGAVVLSQTRFKQLRKVKSIRRCVTAEMYTFEGEQTCLSGELSDFSSARTSISG